MDFNNTYTPFDFNQSTINSNNTLLNEVYPSNFNLYLTIDSKYYTSDEFNLNYKSIFQHGLNAVFHRLLPPMVITAVITGNNLSGKNRFLPW